MLICVGVIVARVSVDACTGWEVSAFDVIVAAGVAGAVVVATPVVTGVTAVVVGVGEEASGALHADRGAVSSVASKTHARPPAGKRLMAPPALLMIITPL